MNNIQSSRDYMMVFQLENKNSNIAKISLEEIKKYHGEWLKDYF